MRKKAKTYLKIQVNLTYIDKISLIINEKHEKGVAFSPRLL